MCLRDGPAPVALLIKLGRHADAEKIQRQLLDANPDNGVYYTRLAECLQIAPGTPRASQSPSVRLVTRLTPPLGPSAAATGRHQVTRPS